MSSVVSFVHFPGPPRVPRLSLQYEPSLPVLSGTFSQVLGFSAQGVSLCLLLVGSHSLYALFSAPTFTLLATC